MSLDVIVDKNTIDKAKKRLMAPLEYYRSAYDYLCHEEDYDKIKYLFNDLLGSSTTINPSNVTNFKTILSSLLKKRIALHEEILHCFNEESPIYLYLAHALVKFSIEKINRRTQNEKEKLDLIQYLENDNKIFQQIEMLLLPLLPEKDFVEIYEFLLNFLENPDLKKMNIYVKKADPIFTKIAHYITGRYIKPKKQTNEKKEARQESSAPAVNSEGAKLIDEYDAFMKDVITSIKGPNKISYAVYRNIFERMIKFWPFVKESKTHFDLLLVKDKYFDFIRELEKNSSIYVSKINSFEENITHYLKTTKPADLVTLGVIHKIRIQAREHLEQLDVDKGEIYKTDVNTLDEQKLCAYKDKHFNELDALIKEWEHLMHKLLPELYPEKPSEMAGEPEIEMIISQVKEISVSTIQEDKFAEKTLLWKLKVEEKRKEKKFKISQSASSSSSSSSSSSVAMIESEDFSELAFERISLLNHRQLELLEKIVNIEFGVRFDEVKHLIIALDGKISNIGNGSSHYKISLCKYSKMIIKNEERSKKPEKSSFSKGQMAKSHGKSHSSGELSYLSLGCVADVFCRAGITQEVVAKARLQPKTSSVMRLE